MCPVLNWYPVFSVILAGLGFFLYLAIPTTAQKYKKAVIVKTAEFATSFKR
jgi:hypothetical protein